MKRLKAIIAVLLVLTLLIIPPAPTASAASYSAALITPENAVNEILSTGITATNVKFTGNPTQLGMFVAPDNTIPVNKGICLSTGYASAVFGGSSSTGLNGPSNTHLTQMAGYSTFDTAVLEFDVTPDSDNLSFLFFFASNEYTYAINFNDVFALWVFDPVEGLSNSVVIPQSGETSLFHYNVARLPNGQIVTLNNSRGGGPDKYTANDMPYATKCSSKMVNGLPVSFNGFTNAFQADASNLLDKDGNKLVQAGRTLTIRMAIADVSDTIVDSMVFIKSDSLSFEDPSASPAPVPSPSEKVYEDFIVPGFYVKTPDEDVNSKIKNKQQPDAYIDLQTDELFLPDDFEMLSYSRTWGDSWINGSVISTKSNNIAKYLSKENEFIFADGYYGFAKKEVEKMIKFPKISPRPKLEKLSVDYEAAHLNGGTLDFSVDTVNKWVLTKKGSSTPVYSGIILKENNDDRSEKTDETWFHMPAGGINVAPLTGTKVTRQKYNYSTMPIADNDNCLYVPGSKWGNITVTSEAKPAKYKIDYKTETVKLKQNDLYSFNMGINSEIVKNKKDTVDISYAIDNGTSVMVRKGPTKKKAAAAAQVIETAPRATLETVSLNCSGGKITSNTKIYEVKNGEKWGSVPKKESGSFQIRIKSTAKTKNGVTTGNAASVIGTLNIASGTENGKTGIISAEIIAPILSGASPPVPDGGYSVEESSQSENFTFAGNSQNESFATSEGFQNENFALYDWSTPGDSEVTTSSEATEGDGANSAGTAEPAISEADTPGDLTGNVFEEADGNGLSGVN